MKSCARKAICFEPWNRKKRITYDLHHRCGAGASVFAFHSPAAIEHAAKTAVSSLSIIFGLSAAVSAMLTSRDAAPDALSNDPHMARQLLARIKADDARTLLRLKILQSLALISVLLGIIFLVAFKGVQDGWFLRCLSGIFAWITTVSLLSTLFLPSLLTTLVQRNAYLQRRSKP